MHMYIIMKNFITYYPFFHHIYMKLSIKRIYIYMLVGPYISLHLPCIFSFREKGKPQASIFTCSVETSRHGQLEPGLEAPEEQAPPSSAEGRIW